MESRCSAPARTARRRGGSRRAAGGPHAARERSTSWSARSTCWRRARRCAPRSRRASRTRRSSTARPGSGKTTLARIIAAVVRRRVRGGVGRQRRQGRGARRDRAGAPSGGARTAGAPSCSSTRSTASTRRSRTRCCRRVEEGLVTLIGATTENPYFEVNSALLSRCQIYELRELGGRRRRGRCCAGRSPTPSAGSRIRPTVDDDALELLATRSGGDARTALSALERAVEAARAGGHADRRRDRRGRAAAQGALLRPRGRPPLRLHLGLDQGDPRLRPRRVALLPRGDARGRRGPAVHRPADGDPRLRGHRQRRPAGAGGRDRRGRGGRPRRPAGVRAQPRAGRRLPGAGAEVERLDHRDLASHAPRPRARGEAAAGLPPRLPLPRREEARARRGLRLPARRAGRRLAIRS